VLRALDLSLARGDRALFTGLSLTVAAGARIGVVGANGVGKTTLLRVLAGLEPVDAGRVDRPDGLRAGLYAQEADPLDGETAREYLARATGVAAATTRMEALTERLGEDLALVDAHARAVDDYVALGGGDLEARTQDAIRDAGLEAAVLDRPVAELSGGMQAKLRLAALVLSRHDVLLLDEPTNDLDLAGLDRLERLLATTRAAVVLVSHDRVLLEGVVEQVLELRHEGDAAVHETFRGGWSVYVEERSVRRRRAEEAHARSVDEQRRLLERERRVKDWSERGARRAAKDDSVDKLTRRGRVEGAQRSAARASLARRSRERVEVAPKPWDDWTLRIDLEAGDRPGEIVVRLDEAVVRVGEFVVGPVSADVGPRTRLAILGANGTGKTTLLRAIAGELPLASGRRQVGPSVRMGRLEQVRRGEDLPLVRAFRERTGLDEPSARSLLAKFGLGAEDASRPESSLSPGERTRAAVAALSAQRVNCLLLDEPTNHLDLEAIEELEDALRAYEGAMVVVTHDRRLLERLEPTGSLAL
jgi:ATPase subunit of ABC transporter with duplicated ATPase domains